MSVLSPPTLNTMFCIITDTHTQPHSKARAPSPGYTLSAVALSRGFPGAQKQRKVTPQSACWSPRSRCQQGWLPLKFLGKDLSQALLASGGCWQFLGLLGLSVCALYLCQIPLFYKDASYVGSESPTPALTSHINSLRLQ